MAKKRQPLGPLRAPAPMDLGFIIMGFDDDPHKIQTTLRSIDRHYDAKSLVVLPKDSKVDYKGAKTGGKSVTSLINAGMEKPPAEWNVVVFAGTRVRERLDQRYSIFLEDRFDIFFPLVWGKANFIDAPLNGLAVHKTTFKEIGKLADNNALEICKMMWFFDAEDRGCRFKAIANTRMC